MVTVLLVWPGAKVTQARAGVKSVPAWADPAAVAYFAVTGWALAGGLLAQGAWV